MKRKAVYTLSCSALLLLSACGGGSSDSGGGSGAQPLTLQNLPANRSVELPASLAVGDAAEKQAGASVRRAEQAKSSALRSPVVRANDMAQEKATSYGYEQITDTLASMEFSILEQSIDLLMLDSVWDQLLAQCADVEQGTPCEIPSAQIQLTFTDSLLAGVAAIEREMAALDSRYEFNMDDYPAAGESFLLGSIVFTQRDSAAQFQYEVELDLPSMESANAPEGVAVDMGGSLSGFYRVKWSADAKRVTSEFDTVFESSDQFDPYRDDMKFTFTYAEVDGVAKATMKESYQFVWNGDTYTDTSFIVLSEIPDSTTNGVNISVDTTSSQEGVYSDSVKSVGQADDNGGFLRSEGRFSWLDEFSGLEEESFFNEEEVFDGEGNLLSYRVCSVLCDDDANWFEVTTEAAPETFSLEESEFFIPVSEEEQLLDELASLNISIVVTGLPGDGGYVIAPQNFSGDFFDILGSGYVYDGVSEFYFWGSEEELSTAVVYAEDYNLDSGEFAYTVVPGAVVSRVDSVGELY